MKAAVRDRYGSPEVLQLKEIDKPAIGDEEILLQVRAAGIDQGVWHLMAGLPYLVRIAGADGSQEELTAASGRRFQPTERLGSLITVLATPFCLLQRPFHETRLGSGLVAVARTPA